MINCKFVNARCVRCGAARINDRQVCGPWEPGLGDRVATGLSLLGITKDRAQAVAQAVGLGDCGCQQRQDALNRVGYKFGLGTPPSDAQPTSAQ